MNLTGAWSIDFLMNVRSLRGRISFDDLRDLKALLPAKQDPNPKTSEQIGYELEWDFAAYEEPRITTAKPYISWTDYWILKPSSRLFILGEQIPIKIACIHASTASLYYEAQKKNPTGDMHKIDAIATDASLSQNEFFFGFSKRGVSSDTDDIIQRLGSQMHPVSSRA